MLAFSLSRAELRKIVDSFKDDSMIQSEYDPNIELDKHIADRVNEIAKKKGLTQREALERLFSEEWENFAKADEER